MIENSGAGTSKTRNARGLLEALFPGPPAGEYPRHTSVVSQETELAKGQSYTGVFSTAVSLPR